MMDGGKKVWVPHPTEGFKLGRIVDIGADSITVEPFDSVGQVRNLYCHCNNIITGFNRYIVGRANRYIKEHKLTAEIVGRFLEMVC